MAIWDGLMKQEILPITEIEKVQSDDIARTSFTKGGNPYPPRVTLLTLFYTGGGGKHPLG